MTARLSMRLNSKTTTQLVIFFDSDQVCTWKSYSVFSGATGFKNNPEETANKGNGPIPKGRYYVVDRPTGGRQDWVRQKVHDWDGKLDWFALFAIDGRIDDYTEVDGVRRGNFRMHPGTRSAGCVTFQQKSDFDEIRQILLGQTPKSVSKSGLLYYGILTVS
ncbi:MAG: DUF2778 domain-containing protein [Planctomycetota bacterium]